MVNLENMIRRTVLKEGDVSVESYAPEKAASDLTSDEISTYLHKNVAPQNLRGYSGPYPIPEGKEYKVVKKGDLVCWGTPSHEIQMLPLMFEPDRVVLDTYYTKVWDRAVEVGVVDKNSSTASPLALAIRQKFNIPPESRTIQASV